MVAVVRFDVAIIGQLAVSAVHQELVVGRKYLGLASEQVHDLDRGALFVVIIDLRGPARVQHPLVDAQIRTLPVKDVQTYLAERSPIVRERPVASRRSRNRSKPAVKNGVIPGQ